MATRWGQQIPGCAWWLLGGLVHDIIPRAVAVSDAEFGRGRDVMATASLLGNADGDWGEDCYREQFRKRRKAGLELLTSAHGKLRLATTTALLRPVSRVQACMFKEKESARPTTDSAPRFATLSLASQDALMDCGTLPQKPFTITGWVALPPSLVVAESDILETRAQLLEVAVGLCMRFQMVYHCPWSDGKMTHPWALFYLPFLPPADQHTFASRFFLHDLECEMDCAIV